MRIVHWSLQALVQMAVLVLGTSPHSGQAAPSGIAACTLRQGAGAGEAPWSITRAAGVAARPGPSGVVGVPSSIRVVTDIPLPGRPVRFDYQTEDPGTGLLYLSHMRDDQIDVFDTRGHRVAGRVGDTPGVTGVWVVPELRKLYASVTGKRAVAVVATDDLRVRATLGPIGFPDGIAYAPGVRRVFVSDESGGGELVIDGPADTVVTRIALGGEAGNSKYDAGSGCILVAVQTLDQIVAIDPNLLHVVGKYSLEGADHPHGMQVDSADRLLFVANEENATIEVVDLASMRVTDIARVGADPDVLAFDPGRRRLYVATESGGLWVFHLDGARLALDGVIDLPHAHTVSVDPATHLIYLPLQDVGGHPVLRILSDLN